MTPSRMHVDQPHKLTLAWGEEQAERLFSGTLARYSVEWRGATTLDFGCAWGYLARHVIERLGAARSYGVDLHPQWNMLDDGWRPEQTPGLYLFAGDAQSIPELQDVAFDVIYSIGTLMLIPPTQLDGYLAWFHDRLRPGGHCILRTRTFFSYCGGDLHRRLKSPLPHLLFSRRTIDRYLAEGGHDPSRYMTPMCAASFLTFYRRAGFEILDVHRTMNPTSQEVYERFEDKLGYYDDQELRTSELAVLLRKPASPMDASVLEGVV